MTFLRGLDPEVQVWEEHLPHMNLQTMYHSFRNHYMFNSKTIFYVTVTVIFGK